jgi:hypothetical protein
MHTKKRASKHVIDGQFHTDGVRVIFPLRTPEASAAKAARGAASGYARSAPGMDAVVAKHLTPAETASYRKAVKLKTAAAKATAKRLLALAREKEKEEKAEAAKEAKRKRKAAGPTEGEQQAKRQKRKKDWQADKWAHLTLDPGVTHVTGVDDGHVHPVYGARICLADNPNAPNLGADGPGGAAPLVVESVFSVTLKEWYTKTGQKARTAKLNKKVKAARRANQLPELPSVKTNDMAALTLAQRERFVHYNQYWRVYGSVEQRKLNMDVYCKKQRMLRAVAAALLPDDTTVLAWGDGDFAHTRRGLPTAVGKTIKRFVEAHYNKPVAPGRPGPCRTTPEFRSSCLCASCHHRNRKLRHGFVLRANGQFARTGRSPTGRRIPRRIHGILQCSHCHTRWSRDNNGAVNIANVRPSRRGGCLRVRRRACI